MSRILLSKVADAEGGGVKIRSDGALPRRGEGFCLWNFVSEAMENVQPMTLSPQQRFAANLRRVRTKVGISQEELARRCDLHRTEVSLLERAGREPRLGTITKLAGSLETTAAVLCEGISWSSEKAQYLVKKPPE